jgi:hypothetical protein
MNPSIAEELQTILAQGHSHRVAASERPTVCAAIWMMRALPSYLNRGRSSSGRQDQGVEV